MQITDLPQLNELVDAIHDRWFNIEQTIYDTRTKMVTMRLEPKRRLLETEPSEKTVFIEVHHVETFTIRDTEHVRDYDLNEISYDADNRLLVMTGGVPILIEMHVSALRIRLFGPGY